jgi:hypothetical protein
VVGDDGRLTGEYVADAPVKLSRRFHPDTREWFAVVEEATCGWRSRGRSRSGDARIAHQHSAANDLLARD